MVSIRKKRHLALQERYKILHQLSRMNRQQQAVESKMAAMGNLHQRGIIDPLENDVDRKLVLDGQNGAAYIDGNSMNLHNQGNLKNRKSTRRKLTENQDACMLRGVYYKNMKWQAAIKVDKKQIHLGTVASMEEAAHLYDRAAFLCGRVPNFELSDEEKQELQGLQWDEFLSMTKEAIANKKKRKRVETCLRRRRTPGSMDGFEGVDIETSSFHHPESFEQNLFPQPEASHQQSSFDEAQCFPQQPVSFHNTTYYHDGTSFQLLQPLQNTAFTINCHFS